MREEFYRSMCLNPIEYDSVIDFIRDNNPYIQERNQEFRESFATTAVHACIRAVIFDDSKPMYSSSGMCIAIRCDSKPTRKEYSKVLLTIHGVHELKRNNKT